MTREEALELAIRACEKTWNEKTCKQIRKALEQEPSGDVIYRQEVFDLCNMRDKYEVKNVITVNPQEPKTGHWIITYPHGKQNPIYECHRCHASNSSVFKNYCPNCGAKMVEPQESEDKE